MSAIVTAGVDRRTRDSVALGRDRGYYRVLFEAGPVDPPTFAELVGVPDSRGRVWIDEQVAAGLLHVVDAPGGRHYEVLLPGEYVPILLGDHGERELAGARALLAEHLGRHPADVERVRAFVDAVDVGRVL